MAQQPADLSEQQKRCLRLVLQGMTSKEISPLLGVTPGVIDNYIQAATQKLGASSRREAARMLAEYEENMVQQLHLQSEAVAEPQFSANVEAPPVTRRSSDHPVIALPKRMLTWVARHIGGPRHDLSKLETIRAILWTALATSGVLAGIITIGYWLNDIFR